MLPLGGLLIVLFAAWALPKSLILEQLGIAGRMGHLLWKLLAGLVAPIGVLAVFLFTLFPDLFDRLFG